MMLLIIARASVATGGSDFYGAVNVVGAQSITSQPYPDPKATGQRTTTQLSDHFPTTCTTCDRGAMTEHCNYEDGFCVKLSDTSISLISVNGSLLHGSPFRLDRSCTPRYLQKLKQGDFAVICWESSYHIFKCRSDLDCDPQLQEISPGGSGARDGILVQSSSHFNHHGFHHVEIVGNDIESHDVSSGGGYDLLFPDAECIETLSLYPTFSSHETFFLSCLTATKKRTYFLHSIRPGSDPIRIDLCSDPLSSPNGGSFAVVCNGSLAVFNNAEHYCSENFGSSITFHNYLNPATLVVILDTGNQYIVDVDIFMDSGGLDGIITLHNTSTCSSVHKLLTHDVYATVCRKTTFYDVQLFNVTNGRALKPVSNLTEAPLDIYFDFSQPSTSQPPTSQPPTVDPGPTTMINPTNSSSHSSSKEGILEEKTDGPSKESPKPQKSGPDNPGILVISLSVVLLFLVLASSVLVALICYYIYCMKKDAKQSQSPSILHLTTDSAVARPY